jgi:hypothetical protein
LTKAAAFNPAVFGPCVTAADPTPDLEACPEPPAAQLPAYAGKGYWNSGVLAPAAAPAGAKQVSVKFDESVAPGSYNYACILHALMGGFVTVDTFSLRFPKAGTYNYVCVLHPGMAGTVKVT